MHTLVIALLLAVVLGFLLPVVRRGTHSALHAHPAWLFAAAAALAAVFSMVAAVSHAFTPAVGLLILAYTMAPVLAVYFQGPGPARQPSWLDLAGILLLWLPLEFSAGAHLIPRQAQGFLHTVAYGVAIILGLIIFAGYRALPGMKYNMPGMRDLLYGIAAFVLVAPVLVIAGRLLGFLPPLHFPVHPGPRAIVVTLAAIFFGTALPEEILFRSLIQNWLTERYGSTAAVLLLAAFIFGCAHLDNGPQPLPNWRYMILATIAGIAYGKAFQKSRSVFSSVTCHALVDATKHIFF